MARLPSVGSRSGRILAVVAAACAGWVAALTTPRDFPVGGYGDDARYVVLGKALRENGRFGLLQLPGEPAETMFPPGYPALLALAWSPSEGGAANLERARWVNLALVGPLAGVLCAAGLALLSLSASASAVLAVAGVLAPIVMARWVYPLSEPLCLLLIACALPLVSAERRGAHLAGLLVLIAAAYVRTIALAFLVGAWIVAWRRKEQRRVWCEIAVAAAALAPWVIWTAVHAGDVAPSLFGMYGSYAQWYVASVRADPATVLLLVPAKNVWLLLVSLGDAVTGYLPTGALVAALVGAGVVWAVWRARHLAPALVAGLCCYTAVVLLWPYPPFRFVGAVWPVALLAVAAGAGRRRSRIVPALAGSALAFALVGFARRAGLREGGGGAEWQPLVATIRPLVPRDAVLASSNPALYYLTLGVRGVPNERMRSYRYYRLGYWSTAWGLGDDLWAIVHRYHPTYLLMERRGAEGRWAAGSLIRQCPGVMREVWSTPRGEYLFAVRSDVACAPEVVKP